MKNIKILKLFVVMLLFFVSAGHLYALRQRPYNVIRHKTIKEYRAMSVSPIGWKVLGYSNDMNPVYYREFGSGSKTLLVIGGLHGDEPAATMSVIKFGEYLYEFPELLKNRVVLIPCINPDGLIMGTRTNANRIDINRNFPAPTWKAKYAKNHNNPGRLPGSEPETVLVVNAIYDYKPWMVIGVHQPFGKIYPSEGVPADLYKKMSKISGYGIDFDIGYDTPGSLGGYISEKSRAIPSITFEIGPIDIEPDYDAITYAFLVAANYR